MRSSIYVSVRNGFGLEESSLADAMSILMVPVVYPISLLISCFRVLRFSNKFYGSRNSVLRSMLSSTVGRVFTLSLSASGMVEMISWLIISTSCF